MRGFAKSLRDEIRQILDATQITTIFVTHDQAEAFSVADRVALMNRGRIVQIGSAKELYQRPIDRFVAEFFGDCNFLQGRGGTRCKGVISLETSSGPVRVYTGDAPISSSASEVTVAIRPEQMFVTASEKQHSEVNCLPATIRNIRHLGPTTRLEVALRDSSIIKIDQQQPPDRLAAGQSVFVCWAPEHGIVLNSTASQ